MRLSTMKCEKEFNNKMLKIAEELSELTSRILQHVNKKKSYEEKIFEEIDDVESRIFELKKIIERCSNTSSNP